MLAIIIPFYKLTFFDNALRSLANQTSKRFKVYLGDDASPEDCTVCLEKYRGLIDFEYRRFENNLGGISLVNHWERCIEMARNEEWIMILGDDDELGSNVVEEIYKSMGEIRRLNIKVVRFSSEKINYNSEIISTVYRHPKIEKSTDFLIRRYRTETRSSLSEYIFFKEVVKKIKFKDFPLAWLSDVLAILEFSNFSDVFTIDKAVVKIRISDKSISGMTDNSLKKSEATELFYLYILKHIRHFKKADRKLIYTHAEKVYLNNKSRFSYFGKIMQFYLSGMRFKYIYPFMRKIIISIFNKFSRRKSIHELRKIE